MTPQEEIVPCFYHGATCGVPFGFCHCKCGGKPRVSAKNDRWNNFHKGIPLEFILGHKKRQVRPPSRKIEIDGVLYRTVPLTKGQEAVVDLDEYESLTKYAWYATKSDRHSSWYAARSIKIDGKKRTMQMHHQVCPPLPGFVVDHKDRNGLHNWRKNLRSVTQAQNLWNTCRVKANTSGFTGAFWQPQIGKWTSQIKICGELVYLGCFDTKQEAAAAYSAAFILRNRFAHLFTKRKPSLISAELRQ